MSFEDVHGSDAGEAGTSSLPPWEEITGEVCITSMLTAISVTNSDGVLHRDGRMERVTLERVQSEGGSWGFRLADAAASWGEAPYDVSIVGYNSVYHLRLAGGALKGTWLMATTPERVVRARHREHRRRPAPQELRARFQHPRSGDPELRERRIRDLSQGGLSLQLDVEDRLVAGLSLSLKVKLGDEEPVDLQGEVRHISGARDEGRRVCGLKVQTRSARDAALWNRLVRQARVPTLGASSRAGDLPAVPWDLYAISDFLRSSEEAPSHRDDAPASICPPPLSTSFPQGRFDATLTDVLIQQGWPSTQGEVAGSPGSVRRAPRQVPTPRHVTFVIRDPLDEMFEE